MSEGGAARFFDAIAGRYERSYALTADESRRRMRTVVGELPPPPARVLDLGVGTGRELAALLDAGHVPTGVDVSREMLERCARRTRPIALVHADFWQPLPFADASFDAVVALHGTLAHASSDESLGQLAGELSRVLRPGGVWITEIPSPAWLDWIDAAPPLRDRSVRRTGPLTCVYEDHAAGASVEARIYSDATWRAALGGRFAVRIESLNDAEWLVVATRA